MIADAIETLFDKKNFMVTVFPGQGPQFEVAFNDVGAMTSLLLRRQRMKHGLTLAEVSKRLGTKSLNSYARYEQGRSVPTMEKFDQLISAFSKDNDIVLSENQKKSR